MEEKVVNEEQALFAEVSVVLNGSQDVKVLTSLVVDTLGGWYGAFTHQEIQDDEYMTQYFLEFNELCDTLERQWGVLSDWNMYVEARKWYKELNEGKVQ